MAEKIFTIPLRSALVSAPRGKRNRRANNIIREYIAKHTKSKEIKISQKLNQELWLKGVKTPIGKLKVKVVHEGDKATAYAFNEVVQKEKPKEEKKAEAKPTKEEKPIVQEPVKETKPKIAEPEKKEVKETKESDSKEASTTEEAKPLPAQVEKP